MSVTDFQLERWASPPSQTETERIQHTRQLIETVLKRNLPTEEIKKAHSLSNFSYEVYVQGSYANSTNISGDSDVDIVVQLNSVFGTDLSQLTQPEKDVHSWHHSDSTYKYKELKNHVYEALKEYFGDSKVEYADKCIKVDESTNRVMADVVPCFLHKVYKRYISLDNETYIAGIKFLNTKDNSVIINFPKVHLTNCEAKNTDTSKKFKSLIRIFKNIRQELIDAGEIDGELAPSYFIENLLYNCSSNCFDGSLRVCVLKCLQFVYDAAQSGRLQGFVCANEQDSLFGVKTWNTNDAITFINAVGGLVID